ncbi:MAG: glycosyltransferase involved in cell wall biosynthesis [Algoriphagus sp.]|jgi:glycosyltransferase involved in cell wall biosynthesis
MKISEDLISVIIPTYNRITYLIEAVESCIAQSYANIEVLIIDDGSTDGTEETLNRLLKEKWKNKPIKYFRQNNAGASAARNQGLQLSKGQYIQFLDSDDMLFPRKIEIQLEALLKVNADGCTCQGIMGKSINEKVISLGENFHSILNLMHKICSGKQHIMCTNAPLWRKSALEKTSGWNPELAFGDDLDFHIRVLLGVKKMEFVPNILFFVREHNYDRLSHATKSIKQVESGIKTHQLITENLKKNGLWDIEFQDNILKRCRALYPIYLRFSSKKNLTEFERWFMITASKSDLIFVFFFLIVLRRLLGCNVLLYLYEKVRDR